jgi:hypothetical protein
MRDDIGPASLPDLVEQAVESRESLPQRPFVPRQQITARLGVRTAIPRDAQTGQGLVDGLAAGQLQWPSGHLDAMRDCRMQRSQHVDDRGPVGVVDRVLETTWCGVDVRKQRQGIPAV